LGVWILCGFEPSEAKNTYFLVAARIDCASIITRVQFGGK